MNLNESDKKFIRRMAKFFKALEQEIDPKPIDKTPHPPVVPAPPYKDIVQLYHEKLPKHPRCLVLSDKRKAHIRVMWRQYGEIGLWRQLFFLVKKSKFLSGKVQRQNRKPFIADFDFLINGNNWIKIMEGKYNDL
jgi:hypothetical protein